AKSDSSIGGVVGRVNIGHSVGQFRPNFNIVIGINKCFVSCELLIYSAVHIERSSPRCAMYLSVVDLIFKRRLRHRNVSKISKFYHENRTTLGTKASRTLNSHYAHIEYGWEGHGNRSQSTTVR